MIKLHILGMCALLLCGVGRAEPPGPTAEMGFNYPFGDKGRTEVMKIGAKLEGGQLVVSLDESDGYRHYSMGFKFGPVMDGTDTYYSDSDSAQVAVVWKNDKGETLARATNARPQLPKRSKDNPAAEWNRVAEGPPAKLQWRTAIPQGAAVAEIVAVYTDTLNNPPHYAPRQPERAARGGDMPLVIASFSARRENGAWQVVPRPDDVASTRKFEAGAYPLIEDLVRTVAAVRTFVRDRTGYRLVARPTSLEGIHSPMDLEYRELERRIDRAVAANEIANVHDTGFDIDPASRP